MEAGSRTTVAERLKAEVSRAELGQQPQRLLRQEGAHLDWPDEHPGAARPQWRVRAAGPGQVCRWVAQAKQALWDGQLDYVIDACLELTRTEDSTNPSFVAARYSDQNRSRMDWD